MPNQKGGKKERLPPERLSPRGKFLLAVAYMPVLNNGQQEVQGTTENSYKYQDKARHLEPEQG